jgi:inosose dehydratase
VTESAPADLGVLDARVAAAPISWGVCEVPGWGAILPPRRVLAGIRGCGLRATELGPPGWLPTEPAALRRELDGLRLVAGFVAMALHHGAGTARAAAAATVTALAGAGASHLVLAAATGADGYDRRPTLDGGGWRALLDGAGAVGELAAEHGLRAVLHPHVGTLVEAPHEIEAFLADSEWGLCLDTGHVLVGGGDPVELAAQHPDRVHHVHLKDVDASVAAGVRAGRYGYAEAVDRGLYRPLGTGDVDVAAIVTVLERAGYRGWYVLEQDVRLRNADEAAAGAADRAVAASLRHLSEIAIRLNRTPSRSRR